VFTRITVFQMSTRDVSCSVNKVLFAFDCHMVGLNCVLVKSSVNRNCEIVLVTKQ